VVAQRQRCLLLSLIYARPGAWRVETRERERERERERATGRWSGRTAHAARGGHWSPHRSLAPMVMQA
jgi:hypothetical protein